MLRCRRYLYPFSLLLSLFFLLLEDNILYRHITRLLHVLLERLNFCLLIFDSLLEAKDHSVHILLGLIEAGVPLNLLLRLLELL